MRRFSKGLLKGVLWTVLAVSVLSVIVSIAFHVDIEERLTVDTAQGIAVFFIFAAFITGGALALISENEANVKEKESSKNKKLAKPKIRKRKYLCPFCKKICINREECPHCGGHPLKELPTEWQVKT